MSIGSPAFPLDFGSRSVFKDAGSMKKLVKFHLTNLLLTNKGEKITNPDYGVGLRRYLFEPIIEQVIDSIESNIENQVNLYLPYLTIDGIVVHNPQDTNTLKIAIRYSIDDLNVSDVLDIDLNSAAPMGNNASY